MPNHLLNGQFAKNQLISNTVDSYKRLLLSFANLAANPVDEHHSSSSENYIGGKYVEVCS